jgi:antitoxin component YwqK of YwqJK toxin-antitoxin module
MVKPPIFILLFASQLAYSQDTLFLDTGWHPSSRITAVYFRIEKKENALWQRKDYYLSNDQLQMRGAYSSLTPETQEGHFEWYHQNGKLKHKGDYIKGKEIGEHLWYNENGNLEAEEYYSNGKLNGIYKEYHPNGQLADKTTFIDGIQNGWTEYYWPNGSRHSEGAFKDGNRDGEWKYYDEAGKILGLDTFKTKYEIKDANMFIKLPNDEWRLIEHPDKSQSGYIFKRTAVVDEQGDSIIPAIMVYVEDAKEYKKDIVLFSINKTGPFVSKGVKIDSTLFPQRKNFPLTYKNALFMKASYTEKGLGHILYMIHIINKNDKGIQVYLDMTKSIADKCDEEFWTTIRSIKEIQ